MFVFIDKLLATFVVVPPLYMLFRFIRWWIKQELQPQEDKATEKTEA
jgi:hypothetical protein